MQKFIVNVIVNQLIIVALVFLIGKSPSILLYINYSFYIGASYLFIGGVIFILRSGFFDFFSTSMKKVFSRDKDILTMRKPSEAVSITPRFFLRSGIPVIVLMLVALFLYPY